MAAALLGEHAPMLDLTQPIEASVAAVYRVIADGAMLEAEFDEIPEVRCTDSSEWELCVECLKDRMQFDDDYEDFGDLTDEPPEAKSAVGSFLGSAPD